VPSVSPSRPSPAFCRLADGFNHPELDWREVSTEHFTIIFHPQVAESAKQVAQIAEEVYEPVCQALGAYPPWKTTIVVTDYNDFSREFMRRLEHTMFIEAPPFNPAMLGRTEWLRHIVRHEFTHAAQYAATGAEYGALGEWVGMAALPEWFVEGTAEWQATSGSLYESGFARRAALSRQLAPLARIDGRTRQVDLIDLWLVYAQAHDMVVYLVRNFGDDVVKRILEYYRSRPDFDLALMHVTGMDQKTLYGRFVQSLTESSEAFAEGETDDLEARSERLNVDLRGALAAAWSPDGAKVAVFGIYGWEDPLPILYVAVADGANMRKVSDQVALYSSAQFSWSPDGRRLAFSDNRPSPYGSLRAKIVVANADGSGHEVISGDLRAIQPAWSPTGDRIACVAYLDETTRLVTMAPDGGDVRIFSPTGAYQCFNPTWSPDGTQIAFSTVDAGKTDIAVVAADGSGYRRLTDDPEPDQYPQWSPKGDRIAFISYRGSFGNVFAIAPEGGEITQLTDVRTASLFYPVWSPDGGGSLSASSRRARPFSSPSTRNPACKQWWRRRRRPRRSQPRRARPRRPLHQRWTS
jgi:Tol biopolymer transport system component